MFIFGPLYKTECKEYYCGHFGTPLGRPLSSLWMVAGYVLKACARSI